MEKAIKILLVEDEPVLRSILSLKLEKESFEVIKAQDGEEALNLLQNQGIKPDLILLDLILPRRNGFEVLETIRHDPFLEKIPVIIISNLGQISDVERGKSLGVIDYFIKNRVSTDDLIKQVKKKISDLKNTIN